MTGVYVRQGLALRDDEKVLEGVGEVEDGRVEAGREVLGQGLWEVIEDVWRVERGVENGGEDEVIGAIVHDGGWL